MSDVNTSGGYRKPETEFEHWVDRSASGLQGVQNGIFDAFFVELSDSEGIMVDSSNVDHEIGRIMCLAEDLGISVSYIPKLDDIQMTQQRRTVDYADFQTEMDAFRASE
jgi:hypothetical protein